MQTMFMTEEIGTKNILIVEDETLLAMDIQCTVEHAGYHVAGIAFSGHDAILQSEEKRPDLVLMDIKLEGYMDGIEAARRIMERLRIPVIFVTGNTDEHTRMRAEALNPAGYISKPVRDRVLTQAINGVFNNQ